MLWTGSIAAPQDIPAGRPAYFDNQLCQLYLSDSPAVFFASVTFHAHLLARCAGARGADDRSAWQRRRQDAQR